MVGDVRVMENLKAVAKSYQSPVRVELDPFVSSSEPRIFGRDWRVNGINGMHIVPYAIQDPIYHGAFMALLPSSSNYFIHTGGGKGEGFSKENSDRAAAYAKEHGIPFRQASSTVEGGNAFVFFDENQPKAIVGIHSLILTLIALDEQGFFEKNQNALKAVKAQIKKPSEHALRMARNMSIYTPKRDWDKRWDAMKKLKPTDPTAASTRQALQKELGERWKGESSYRELLTRPLLQEETVKFHDEALMWEARMMLAQQVIAKDLSVPLESCAFIPQIFFHTDMFLTVSPDGKVVFLHDDTRHDEDISPPLEDKYRNAAKERAGRMREAMLEAQEAINKIGCKVRLGTSICASPGNLLCNFTNGIFLSTPGGPLFVSNGPTRNFNRITDVFCSTFPFKTQVLLDCGLSDILADDKAGLHCLTWEHDAPPSTPAAIIASYLADEPIPSSLCSSAIEPFFVETPKKA